MNDYKELIAHVQGDAAFRHIISECGADGRVWFDKRFICDYVSHLKYAIEQLVKEREVDDKIIESLQKELVEAASERDAAVADFVAKHCNKCIINYPYWEWRGVKEGER